MKGVYFLKVSQVVQRCSPHGEQIGDRISRDGSRNKLRTGELSFLVVASPCVLSQRL